MTNTDLKKLMDEHNLDKWALQAFILERLGKNLSIRTIEGYMSDPRRPMPDIMFQMIRLLLG